MKRIIFLTMTTFNILLAQQSSVLNADKELYVGVINAPEALTSITFVLEAISPVWARDNNDYTVPYLTTEYDWQEYIISQPKTAPLDGFNFCFDPPPAFGFGLYKLYEQNSPSNSLILDYRDENYGHYQTSLSSNQDIWVQYDYSTNSFKWSTSANNIIWKSETMKIWTAKGISSPSTDNFEPIVPPNFEINIIDETWPKLTWDDFNQIVQNYEVYRCITEEIDDQISYPIRPTYTVSSGENTSFIDYSVQDDGGVYAHYKVVAINGIYASSTENITFKIIYPEPPSAPQNLQVTTLRDHPVLSWAPNPEENIDEYIIYIRENSGNWLERGRVSSSYRSYTDLLTTTATPYDFLEYHIKAKNTNNLYSDMSNIVSVMGITEKRVAETDTTQNDKKISKYSISNFPNPFNPTTVVYYTLKERGNVVIKIYDMLGKEIAVLVDETKPMGEYVTQFNGNDLSSGVYIMRMQINNFSTSKKILLTK